MKTILCFGDSNTWGFDADSTPPGAMPARHPPQVRWPGIVAAALGSDYRVIEDAQNGRMTVHDDPLAPTCRNARRYLPTCLDSHKPIDLVVLMLGTNDLKTFLNLPPQDITNGIAILLKQIAQSEAGPAGRAPQVLLVAPPAMGDMSALPDLAARFAHARAKSLELPRFYEALAKQQGTAYLNAQLYTQPSPLDDIHLDAGSHAKLGAAVAAAVLTTLVG
jgi:lysophospholipase L1-like esterase